MTIDTVVNSFMGSIENPVLVTLSKWVAPIFEPMVLVVVSLIIAFYLFIKSSKAKGIFFGGIMLFTGGFIFVTKEIFKRMRPLNALLFEPSYSFPSGHATISIVFFGLLVYLFVSKKSMVQGVVVASLMILFVGFSRIYLRVHWLTDVLLGFVFGGIILAIGILLFRRFD